MVEIDYSDDDEIMAELRQIRAEIHAEFGDDVHRYFEHLREVERRDRARGAVYVDLRPPRRQEHDAA